MGRRDLLLIILINTASHSDEIKVHNQTNYNLYGMLCYYSASTLEQVTEVILIPKQQTACFERPPRKSSSCITAFDRQLLVSYNLETLKQDLARGHVKNSFSANVGARWGSQFYLVSVELGILKLYSQLGYILFHVNTLQITFDTIEDGFKRAYSSLTEFLKQQLSSREQQVYNRRVAQVRRGNELCSSEYECLAVRHKKILHHLKQLVQCQEIKKTPTVSVICSGGGYRAMFSTLGWLIGAQEIGLLDVTSYISTLSGSSWAVGTWMSTRYPLVQLKDYFIHQFETDITHLPNLHELKLLAHALLIKKTFGQPFTLIDIYGGLLATKLFRGFEQCRQFVYLSDQQKGLQDGMVPFPLYSALSEEKPHYWYEFSPYEIGSAQLEMYVPSWSFGRKFNSGYSVDFSPEQSLGFEFGIFGSAFAANVGQVYDKIINKLHPDLDDTIKRVLTTIEKKRLTYAMVFNFTYGMHDSAKKSERFMKFIDAAFDFNLSYPPVSGVRPERSSDVLIFLDSSNYTKDDQMFGYALYKAEQYAHIHGLKFPKIDYSALDQHAVHIFKDEEDTSVPLVIYMPLVREERLWLEKIETLEYEYYKDYLEEFDPQDCIKFAFCSTFNFRYTAAQIEQLVAQTEFNMKASRELLVDALKWKLSTL